MKKAIVLLLSAVLAAPALPAFAQEDKAEKKKQTRAEKRAERRAEREHRREERQARRDAKHKKAAPAAEEKK
ncbi:MAG TPA: hypothetical protein VN675_07105 [Burkholderiales bacterium]|nr:hypothetical protein [Burkholderiales bacterium]